MKDFLQRTWMPFAGSAASLSFKGIIGTNDTLESAAFIAEKAAKPEIVDYRSLFFYLLVGFAGAFGGLLLKICWSCIKRKWPKLKNIDK
jgi:hypothetical protein